MGRRKARYLRRVGRKGGVPEDLADAPWDPQPRALWTMQAARLIRARKARRLTQLQLAEALSVTQQFIAKMERGNCIPRPEILEALHAALGVSRAFLICGDEELEQELLGMMPADAPGTFLSREEVERRERIAACAAEEMRLLKAEANARADASRALARERKEALLAEERERREQVLKGRARFLLHASPGYSECEECGSVARTLYHLCEGCFRSLRSDALEILAREPVRTASYRAYNRFSEGS